MPSDFKGQEISGGKIGEYSCPELEIDLTKFGGINSENVEEIRTRIPHIYVKLADDNRVLLMCDSGAEVNLLKVSCLPKGITPYPFKIILRGIGDGRCLTLGVIKWKIGNIDTIFHVVGSEATFRPDGILGAEFFRESDAQICFKKQKILLGNSTIDFIPMNGVLRSSLELVEQKRTNFPTNNIWRYAEIPEIPVNIVAKGINFQEKIEDGVKEIDEKLELNNKMLSLEEKISNLSELISSKLSYCQKENVKLVSRGLSEGEPKTSETENDEIYCNEPSLETEISYVDFRMIEYEVTMDEMEKRAREEMLGQFKPIYLNFCKGMDFLSTKIYHSTRGEIPRMQRILNLASLDDLREKNYKRLFDTIERYENTMYLKGDKWQGTNSKVGYHRINLKDDKPVITKSYRLPYKLEEVVDKQIDEWLKLGIIQESTSNFRSNLWVVPKPDDRKTGEKRWRTCVDFRALNLKTISEDFPIPKINELLDKVRGSKIFSKFDLSSGFLQIPIDPRDRHKTAFSTHRGKYEFTHMPFGLKNSPWFFQRAVGKALKTLIDDGKVIVYIDDILIFTDNLEEHLEIIEKVLKALEEYNFKVEINKCEFLREEIKFLGHIINENGVQPDQEKIEAVQKFEVPVNKKQIRQFLGMSGFYRRFIKNYAEIAKVLSDLLRNEIKWEWSDKHQEAFDNLKKRLCEFPILIYPDLNKEFLLFTDASGYAIGACLAQGTIKKHNPVAYYSRVLRGAEERYSTYEKEALAIYESIRHFRQYLYANKFTVVTDHKPLTTMQEAENNGRVQKMRLKLQGYDFDIVHTSGK